ncbi:MAG: CAP domain-containing protein [Spirochaetes bacterium]|jgi:hypothetical protein|nr:CAP domain-containing protein [Spirochaetota bacterium]
MRFAPALLSVTICLCLSSCFTAPEVQTSRVDGRSEPRAAAANAVPATVSDGAVAAATGSPTAEEERLYELIMAYRTKLGLPAIPLSPSLTTVAQVHVRDLEAHFTGGGTCNLHSWSDNGDWTPCCYTSDHARAECMWNKPRELTDYPGSGYEISYTHSAQADAAGALRSWQGSSGHNSVIVNAGVWESHPWGAIGVGIYGRYAVVWFGEERDPAGG